MINPHPGLPDFQYIKPASLVEANQFLTQHVGEAKPFLGGTDVFVRLRDGLYKDKYLVDVKHLEGMSDISFDPTLGLTVGAAVNMNQVIASPVVRVHYPLLAEACRSVASYQLRTRATVAGNICNASPAGDTIGACLVYQGQVRIFGKDGYRSEQLSGFFLGPGKTTLAPGDIVTEVYLPIQSPGSFGTYIKLGRNQLSDLSIVGVTVLGYPDALVRSGFQFHIALASVAPIPLIPTEAEIFLAEHPINSEILKQAAMLAQEACNPIDDVRGSARYRKLMVNNITFKALNIVWEQLKIHHAQERG